MGGECGIGLKVERTAVGYVVTGLKHKFPAHRQGVLKVGFLIVSVDGVDVTNSLCALPPLVLGQEGTPVSIGFVRAPGEQTEHVDIVRGGAGAGNNARSLSSLSQYAEHSASTVGLAKHADAVHSSAHELWGHGTVDGSPTSTAADELHNMPAMRVNTGASSAMELRMYGNHSSSDMGGMDRDESMPDSPVNSKLRSRSVALLPSAGSKHRYIPHTPTWRIDANPVAHRPLSSLSAMSRTASSAASLPSSPGRTAVAPAGVMDLRPTVESSTKPSPQMTMHAGGNQETESAQNKNSAGRDELSDQQKQALVVFARTPEGKMWKAERLREKHAVYDQQRSEWAKNSVIRELPPTSGKFSTANPKSQMDWIVHYAQQLPGAGAYNPKLPLREGRKDPAKTTSKFGTASRFGPSTIDHSIPGAGKYNPSTSTFSKIGGKFNGSSKVTAMEMDLRHTADLPGPGEYDDYDREHRQIHLKGLAGKFSETVRMGRDLAQAEASKVPGAGAYTPLGTRTEQVKKVRGGLFLQKDGQSFVDQAARRARDIPGPLDTVWDPSRKTGGGKFSSAVVPSNVDILCRETAKIPGPGTYKTKAGHKRRFTTFCKAVPETNIDKLAKVAGKVPGPGAYGEGGICDRLKPHVPTSNLDAAKGASGLDRHLKQVGQIPGPGMYGAPMKMGPTPHGIKFAQGNYSSDIDIKTRDAAQKPGPGQYARQGVPDFHRLPQNDRDWKAYVAYYPEMRYRET